MATPWYESFIPNLLAFTLVEETGERLRFLQPMDIVKSGKSIEGLKKEAMENLLQASKHLTPQASAHNILRFEVGDGHDASRLVRYLTTDRGHGRVRDGEYDFWPAFDRVGARGMYARV